MVFDPDRQLAVAGVELTANEQFLDAMIRHQIGLLRVAGGLRNRVWELLDATEADLRRQVREEFRKGVGMTGAARVARLERLLARIEDIRGPAWDEATGLWLSEVTAVSLAEPRIVDGLLKSAMPVDLDTKIPNARRLRDIVQTQPFAGKVLRDWAKDIASKDVARIQDQIRIGLTQGESGPTVARRIVGRISLRGTDGVTAITRRQADALTRTAVNAIANRSRQDYHIENSQLILNELFVATLDSRTTKICARNDGKRFPIGEGPLPPLHFNCRSLRTALVDPDPIGERPARSFTQRMLLREFSEAEGITAVTSRSNLPRGTKQKFDAFARRRKRELTGRVPAKVGFQEFLTRQSSEFQSDYLGSTRAKLFRDGGLTLDRLVEPSGRELRLDELARKHAEAFRAAGLDPADFLE